jgi:uncharacterized membrane protein
MITVGGAHGIGDARDTVSASSYEDALPNVPRVERGAAIKNPVRVLLASSNSLPKRAPVMPSPNPRSTASLRGHPFHAMLVPIPIVCFVGTLITDIVYWQTAAMLWADMSAWLLVIGLLVSVFAAAAGLIDFFGERRIRELRPAWIHFLGNTTALILSTFNAFIHTRDAYTSVVPTGLILSALVVLILLVTGWNGWSMVYRYGVGVRQEDRS